MDSNPQLVMQCAGAHHHCCPRRCVDSNHRRVVRCAGAHHHPRPPQGKEACVKLRTYHNTHYVPVHNKAVNPPPRERSVCQDARVSLYTLRAGAQHSVRREIRVRRRYTSQIVTDGVPTHITTFVHAGAWIVTLSLLCGVPAHTTTVVHAGA